VAVGFTLSKVIQVPTRQIGMDVLGSPLGVQLSTAWLIVIFSVGLVITGIFSLFRLHPAVSKGKTRQTYVFWILPGFTVLTSGVLLAHTEVIQAWLLLIAGAIILLRIVVENEFRSLDLDEPGQSAERLLVKGLVYFLFLTCAMLVYATRARTLLVAPAVGAGSGLLSMRLFWRPMRKTHRVILYGGVLGLMMSQVVWAINYWQIPSLSGGLLLLLFFYVATNVVEQSMLGRMSGRVLVEYGVIALIAAVAILRSQA
jgi:hypothetical protein